ncbi:DNA primase [bacterium BMS3Abin04]|nr:DNA primase [bacterium BMS3Abin04]
MTIPEEKIDEIRNSVSIVDFISGFVQLKKRGKNYIGLCPFHQEKTASFTVSEDKQIYHCFGCHAGGNIFKFLMDFKNISFVESVQEVAEFGGIQLSYQGKEDSEKQSLQEELYEINLQAAKYFSKILLKEPAGEVARNYFEKRKIKIQTQKVFGLGYALPSWDNLLNYFRENKIDLAKAKTLGLIDAKDGGQFYDKFRDRIIFPIFSPNGRVVAFGGRILQNDKNAAKYLNSPESIIYLKRKSLYGLYHSKEEIRKMNKAILVEGYMDLISLYQNGIKNVVASSGTSLTEDQIRLLSRYTKNIVVLFDADIAGQNAAMRSIELLLKQDFEIKVLSLPEGDDPDSYINKNGKEQFEEILQRARNFLEYQTAQYEAKGAFKDPGQQAEAIRELIKSASLVRDDLKRSILLKSIARKFSLREKLIETELERYLKLRKRSEDNKRSITTARKAGLADLETNVLLNRKMNHLEKEIISLLYEGNKEIVELIFDSIHPDDLENPKLKELANIVYEGYQENDILPAALVDKIEDEESRDFILSLSLGDTPISTRWENYSSDGKVEINIIKFTKDVIKKFNLKRLEKLIGEKNAQISKLNENSEIVEVLNSIKVLQEERKQLLNPEE